MTQQQYAPAQVPQGYAQPGYPPAPAQYQAPAQAPFQQQFPQQMPQQFPQGYGQPQPPQQPLAQGSLDDFYSQPTSGGGPGISWSDKAGNKKPIGTTYVGVVARDVTHGDVQQQTNPQGMPQFFRDGRPKFQMKVPLKSVLWGDQQHQLQPSPEFPEGEAAWYVRGQARDELTRAMAAAGCSGSPREGATVQVTLINRRASTAGFQPANIVQVIYTPGPNDRPGQQPTQAPAEQAQAPAQNAEPPVSATVAAHPAQPVPGPQLALAQQQVQAYAQQPQQPAPQPVPQQPIAVPQGAGQWVPDQQVQAPAQVQQPAMQQPAQQVPQAPAQPLQPPADLNPDQQALLARLTGQQQG